MKVLKVYERKAVALLSTISTGEMVPTGKCHWQTRLPTEKPEIIVLYNKYMGGVDCNDQLLQYSGFNRRSLKWWKKVTFRMFNLAMVNAFVLYSEWFRVIYPDKPKPAQGDYRLSIIKKLLDKSEYAAARFRSPSLPDIARLTGRHFAECIPSTKKQLRRKCIVCVPGETLIAKRHNIPKVDALEMKLSSSVNNVMLHYVFNHALSNHVYTDYVQKYCMDFDK